MSVRSLLAYTRLQITASSSSLCQEMNEPFKRRLDNTRGVNYITICLKSSASCDGETAQAKESVPILAAE